jgi:hypothetical protein
MNRSYILLIFILVSCHRNNIFDFTATHFYNTYQDLFISNCFYYYTDNKVYKERFDCSDHLFLSSEERVYLDSLVVSLKIELNDHIVSQSEGMTSLYLYGRNNTNLLEDSLKQISKNPNLPIHYPPGIVMEPINKYTHHSAPPTYFCVAQAVMKVVRSKEFEKNAINYSKRRIKEHNRKVKMSNK